MHQLNDQWIEIIDGQEHMVKAVEPFELCQGCLFNCNQGGCCWKGFDDCQMGNYFIIKDLGIMKDGMLQCHFCGEYPIIVDDFDEQDNLLYAVEHECAAYTTTGWCETKQQAKDAWNRRV